jgi:GT2 family glycosyltransferase
VQEEALGLTDLWNKIIMYAAKYNYQNVFIINNDVLVADGAIAALVSALDSGMCCMFVYGPIYICLCIYFYLCI